jgi:hypothetical protein
VSNIITTENGVYDIDTVRGAYDYLCVEDCTPDMRARMASVLFKECDYMLRLLRDCSKQILAVIGHLPNGDAYQGMEVIFRRIGAQVAKHDEIARLP